MSETPPALHGDSVTDDTAAVEWYFERGLDLPEPREGMGYSVHGSGVHVPTRGRPGHDGAKYIIANRDVGSFGKVGDAQLWRDVK